ncbi:hypothetical protein SODALDRAFT_327722 [Sodiomyces alkalinus F11]|uniref:Uncharacterized protein n=1 Tax=Sodiomyces alkalinus (strain CBS 110278 / VKM F-3762 / F11) TaxID=1314773 RepID=A0A3N2Q9U9_SODAK|nr:hypothetical protein SODALDRAFT_327722 [Sodiomyces alkalinus F11]ROT43516.1 hypothetical protein SODALDRAFT_327722 [Sodiomyces alkalinus F11]
MIFASPIQVTEHHELLSTRGALQAMLGQGLFAPRAQMPDQYRHVRHIRLIHCLINRYHDRLVDLT